jgi:hypothetical protein
VAVLRDCLTAAGTLVDELQLISDGSRLVGSQNVACFSSMRPFGKGRRDVVQILEANILFRTVRESDPPKTPGFILNFPRRWTKARTSPTAGSLHENNVFEKRADTTRAIRRVADT